MIVGRPPRGLRGRPARAASATAARATSSTPTIELTESMGSEIYAYFRVEGGARAVRRAARDRRGRRRGRRAERGRRGRAGRRAPEPRERGARRAATRGCGSTPSKLHLFDPESGRALGAHGADGRRRRRPQAPRRRRRRPSVGRTSLGEAAPSRWSSCGLASPLVAEPGQDVLAPVVREHQPVAVAAHLEVRVGVRGPRAAEAGLVAPSPRRAGTRGRTRRSPRSRGP